MALELQPRPGMAWTYRRKTAPWQRRLDRILDPLLAALSVLFLAELLLLLK
jgi:hypothetical protein